MGHDHGPSLKIPHYSIYNNYKEFPELVAHEKRLAQLGLKDPWVRNFVYLYEKNPHPQGKWMHFKNLIMPGWKLGVGVAAGMILIEEAYLYAKTGKTSWDAHH